jgi:hypothetical protein
MIAIGCQESIVLCSDADLQSIFSQTERAEVVKLNHMAFGEVDVVDEVDNPAGRVGIERR